MPKHTGQNFRCWHKADMETVAADFRYRGLNGHRMSAFLRSWFAMKHRPVPAPLLANVRDAERPIGWHFTLQRTARDGCLCVSGRRMPGKAEMASVEEGFG